jgi:glycosyltransferase involved in cell wall biosynthesis
MVGKPYDPSYYNEIQLLIERTGHTGDIIIIPGESGDNLKELYQNTKLFIFPSLIENSPNILLEAMMAGPPVLASSLPPMPEFCEQAAGYFNALDVSDMAEKIEALLNEPNRLNDLAERSQTQARKFSWNGFVNQVLHLINKSVG